MLIRDFTYVALPAADVCSKLLADHGSWLSPLAIAAAEEGDALRIRIGPLSALPFLSKTARVILGEPAGTTGDLIVPLTWEATGPRGAFPVLHGDLRVAPLGDQRTQITLEARYEPPLGAVGRRLDTIMLHRVAEASVRNFLERVAGALTRPAPD